MTFLTFFIWLLYGSLTSTIIYFLFPTNLSEVAVFIIVLGIFSIVGGMDFIASHSTHNKRASLRY